MNANAMLIIVGLIGIAIGFALGVALMSLRGPQDQKDKDVSSQIQARIQTPPPKVVPAPDPAPRLVSTPGLSIGDPPPPLPQRPTINPINVLARVLQPELSSAQAPPKSIAAQIDEILQEMLEHTPLASRGIRLMEFPNRGLVVLVGLDQYEGVDAVPDEDIRALIRTAVQEWERRYASSS